MRSILAAILALPLLLQAGEPGTRVQYVGGTVADGKKGDARIDISTPGSLALRIRKDSILIPWRDVDTLEYGLRVSRRYVEAALISPIFLVGKKKTHFLTIGYVDAGGERQAVVLEVSKGDIRALLVSLEARTGLRVEYQDEEARKAGKG